MTLSTGRLTRRALLASAGAAITLATAGAGVKSSSNVAERTHLRFFALGDWGKVDSSDQRRVAEAMRIAARAAAPDFVVSLGDNFYEDGVTSVEDPKWQTAFESVYDDTALRCPWYSVLGNHDVRGNVEAEMAFTRRDPRWRMPGRYYEVRMSLPGGGVADFFFLDTNVMGEKRYFDTHAARSQLGWLKGALAASQAQWKIVAGHHAVFSGGYHGNNRPLVQFLKPLLDRYGVAAYLNGHDHILQHIRVDGVHYLTSGSGGSVGPSSRLPGTLFDASELGFMSARLNGEALAVAFVGADGTTLYEARIPPRA